MALLPQSLPAGAVETPDRPRPISLASYERRNGEINVAPPVARTVVPYILGPQWQEQSESLRQLIQRALWLAERCADYEATQILRARLAKLQEPALLVVVGEVKAGKSSFINALLREDVCEVAPGPCTTGIRELVHGGERGLAHLGPAWDRIYLPKDVLREVSIVDTPGTNSMIQNHQTITENYVPQSDMVVFVFSAANPHTKSAWEFLSLIRQDWHRKTVFVLQQSDRASDQELFVNREHVTEYARERKVENPAIFTLSAKREMESGLDGGFAEFRHYLQSAIARGEVWRVKVEGCYETVRSVMDRLRGHLHLEKQALAAERAFYAGLLAKVEAREAKAASLKQLVVDKISVIYDELGHRSEEEFAEGIGARRLLRRAIPFLRDKESDGWREHLNARFYRAARKEIETEARRITTTLSQEIWSMMEELSESLARKAERMPERTVLPSTLDGLKMLQDVRVKLQRVPVSTALVKEQLEKRSEMGSLIWGGGLLGLVGLLIMALARNTWLDLGGMALACLSIFLVASGIRWRRADILRDLRETLAQSRKEFHQRLAADFGHVFDGLFFDARQALTETIFRLDLEASHITPVLDETFRTGEAASEGLLNFQRNLATPIGGPTL